MYKTEIAIRPERGKKILMCQMNPCDIGVIRDGECKGHIVMRTASPSKFEVMDLSNFGRGQCWLDKSTISVRLFTEKQSVNVAFYQDKG